MSLVKVFNFAAYEAAAAAMRGPGNSTVAESLFKTDYAGLISSNPSNRRQRGIALSKQK